MTKGKTSAQQRLDADTLGVLGVLKMTPGKELSYQEIAAATGIPDTARLRAAVRHARRTAGHRGNRLEAFMHPREERTDKAHVTRYWPKGQGDPAGTRDGLRTAKIALSAVDELARAADFQAKNPSNPDASSFGQIATAAASCIEQVAGAGEVGREAMRKTRENALRAQRTAHLEADLEADLAALDDEPPTASCEAA